MDGFFNHVKASSEIPTQESHESLRQEAESEPGPDDSFSTIGSHQGHHHSPTFDATQGLEELGKYILSWGFSVKFANNRHRHAN